MRSVIFLICLFAIPPLVTAQKNTKQSTVTQLQSNADSLYKTEAFDEAIVAYRLTAKTAVAYKDWDTYLHCQQFTAQIYGFGEMQDSAIFFLNDAIAVANAKKIHKKLPYLHLALGRIHANLFDQAGTEAALEAAEQSALRYLSPKDIFHAEIALTRSRIAIGYQDYLDARKYGLQSLKAYENAGKTTMEDLYRLYLNLGIAELELLNFEQALYYHHKIEDWLNQLPSDDLPPTAGRLYDELGTTFSSINEYEKALAYHQKALLLTQQLYGDDATNLYFHYANLGDDYMSQKNWAAALEYLKKSLVAADTNTIEPGMRTYIRSKIATTLSNLNRDSAALAMWAETFEQIKLNPDEAVNGPLVWQTLGKHYESRQNYEEALRCYEKEVVLRLEKPDFVNNLSDAYASSGRIFQLKKQWAEAVKIYGKALSVFEKDGLPANESALNILSEQADALYNYAMSTTQPAERLSLLQQSLQHCRQAVKISRKFRQSYHRSPDENFEWVSENQQLFAISVKVAHQLALETKQQDYQEQAFLLADQSKSLLLNEALKSAEAKAFANLPDQLLQQEADLSRTIAYLERKVEEAAFAKDTATFISLRDGQLFSAKRSYERLLNKFAQQYPGYYDLRYDTTTMKITQLRKKLPADAALISYLSQPEQGLLYIFTLTATEPVRTIVVPLDTQNNTRVLDLRRLLQSPFLIQTPKRNQFIDLSHQLYKQYIGPIADQLKGYKQLVIIGDGTTQSLPFDILLSNDKKAPFEQINFLIRDFDISYHYSAQLYTRQQKAVERVNVFTFAPVFSKISPEMRGSSRTNDNDDGSFQSLPYSEQEVKEIGQAFQNKNIVELTGEQANEHALKQQLRKPWHIVHIASHSFANLEQPKFSGIACYPQKEEKDGEDGIVYVNEIYTLPMQADLVVLSSCESGLGQIRPGEGMLGLNRAFLYSGVHNIIFSLWTANDRVTSNLMRAFYKNVAASMPYNKALNDAKRQLLNNPTTASPSFWANFQIVGN
jgi:CHAT domain-containing protein